MPCERTSTTTKLTSAPGRKSIPADCDVCGKTIRRASDMPRHMKIHATNVDDLKYYCPICERGFLQKSNMNTHIDAMHSKVRSKKCPDCPFATSDPGSLTRHRKRLHAYDPKAQRKTKRAVPTPTTTPQSPSPSPSSSHHTTSETEAAEGSLQYLSSEPLFLSHDHGDSPSSVPTIKSEQDWMTGPLLDLDFGAYESTKVSSITYDSSSSDSLVPKHLQVALDTALDGRVFQGMEGLVGSDISMPTSYAGSNGGVGQGYGSIFDSTAYKSNPHPINTTSRFYPSLPQPTLYNPEPTWYLTSNHVSGPTTSTYENYQHTDIDTLILDSLLSIGPSPSIPSPTSSTSSSRRSSYTLSYPQWIPPTTHSGLDGHRDSLQFPRSMNSFMDMPAPFTL
ncbi:hypothetical protein JAAARDRAFT_62313 [Jaapia argillacea MUCL 33604]|uniref:C2H2-type domain-containing protein n=1 Tax=Jaapia argillacea MUCL 33604 TaxID=933084 RepID=A0A067PD63_9AGAM|nr:hypothetical protein JAAARDRAFT_62313 [Jaapia argillacea MUCL 33604]